MDLQGKVALVTGSAKRIGKTLALALAQSGCHIFIHYHQSKQEAEQTALEIKANNVQCWLTSADLNDEAAVADLIPTVWQQAGRLDILINNASVFPPEDFFEVTSASWEENMMLHVKTPFLLSQAFARALPETTPGKIINLLDTASLQPRNHHFSYTLSKFALAGLTKATAHALAQRNIHVNGIALGAILASVNDDQASFERLAHKIPMGRIGSPHDVVVAMMYLLKADYVTGEIIRVDGGKHLG